MVRLTLIASLAIATGLPTLTMAQTICDSMITAVEKTACEIGYEEGAKSLGGGTAGEVLDAIASSNSGAFVVIPANPGNSKGFEIIGIEGANAFDPSLFPTWQEWFGAVNVANDLQTSMAGHLLTQPNSNFDSDVFKFSIDSNTLTGFQTYSNGAWSQDYSIAPAPTAVMDFFLDIN